MPKQIKVQLSEAVKNDLQQILDYLFDDEQADYLTREPNDRHGHVFEAIQTVSKWLSLNSQSTTGRTKT